MNSFITPIKTKHVYKDIANDFEQTFDISSYEINRSLLKLKNKKVIELMKDKHSRKNRDRIYRA